MATRSAPAAAPSKTGLREGLATLVRTDQTNVGLWLDKYLATQAKPSSQGQEPHPRAVHIGAVCKGTIPDGWVEAVKRWEDAQKPRGDGTELHLFVATTLGRCVVGLGAESPWENNIRLHRTWGVPILPGSALKGLAAAWAHRGLSDERWGKSHGLAADPGDAHRTLFGMTEEQGCVVFHDAIWSSENKDNGLRADVMTVHHPNYYQQGTEAPVDWDSPNPIPFLSLTGSFLVALEGPRAWVEAAADMLAAGLQEFGIGAKTSSGYGRMKLEQWDPETRTARPRISAAEQATLVARAKAEQATLVARAKEARHTAASSLAGIPASRRDEIERELERLLGVEETERADIQRLVIGPSKKTEWMERLEKYLATIESRRVNLADAIAAFGNALAAARAPVSPTTTTPAFDIAAFKATLPATRDDAQLKALLPADLSKPTRKAIKTALKDRYGNDGGWIETLLKD